MSWRRGIAAAVLTVSAATTAPSGAPLQSADVDSIRVGLAQPGGGFNTVTMPLDAYVARVLAGEAARDSDPAALAALAITVRTFAIANLHRHRADGFDLCDQTHCQVVRTATAATERAAQATTGQVLLDGGAIASVYYTASCGGRSEIPSDVWPGADDPPYLPSRADDACEGRPVWRAELDSTELLRALRAAGFRGERLREVRVLAHNAAGRVSRLGLDGLTPDQISAPDLRVAVGRTLGWQYIKSTDFELHRHRDVYRFDGHGFGHGVGMCVIGAARLAKNGRTAGDILQRYFPGLQISAAARTARRAAPAPLTATPTVGAAFAPDAESVIVSLPDGDEGSRGVIVKEVIRARDELAHTLGVIAPSRLTLRFHATADDYERATGHAWFTSAAIVGDELHFLPLASLRERGIIDRTIRHQLAHAMVDPVLAGRPVWVREGAAVYFSSDVPSPVLQRPAFAANARRSCPDDNELLRPVSVGALSNAFARARACFARQVQGGRSWRDVR